MIQLLNSEKDNVIAAILEGKISKTDVESIHSRIHQILKSNQKVDFYFEMHDFEGYTLKGFWEDIKVDSAHISDYEKWLLWAKRNGRNGSQKLPISLQVRK